MNAIVVLPSYNPDEKLVMTVKGLVDANFDKIVVVNDGSSEEHTKYFEDVAKLSGVDVLVHEVNKGKGAAMKTAFSYILQNYEDCTGVVTVDGDGQHLPHDIIKCVEAMEHDEKVILGVRDFSKKDVPPRSRFGNNLTRFVFKVFCGISISDTQTGLRAIPREYIELMTQVEGQRYEYETNQLLVMKKEKVPFSEVTIETVYEDGNKTSHFNPITDSLKIYKVIFKFTASAICSFFVDIIAFTVINFLIGSIMDGQIRLLVATVCARIISSLVNFFMNQRYVFKSDERMASTLPRYYALCVCQTALSYGLLYFFAEVLLGLASGILESVVKCIVDFVLFLLSFQIQKRWVFRKMDKNKENYNG